MLAAADEILTARGRISPKARRKRTPENDIGQARLSKSLIFAGVSASIAWMARKAAATRSPRPVNSNPGQATRRVETEQTSSSMMLVNSSTVPQRTRCVVTVRPASLNRVRSPGSSSIAVSSSLDLLSTRIAALRRLADPIARPSIHGTQPRVDRTRQRLVSLLPIVSNHTAVTPLLAEFTRYRLGSQDHRRRVLAQLARVQSKPNL